VQIQTLSSTNLYTPRDGLEVPVDFAIREVGRTELFVGRCDYHKVD
jgi:hypothetical protein